MWKFWRSKAAATSIEYCLIAGIVSLAILLGVTTIGVNLNRYFVAVAGVH